MRYVGWILKLALFLAVLTFAMKNTAPVTVNYYLGIEWEAPLILVLLAFFAAGAALGLAAGLAKQFRQRREIAQLKRELKSRPVAEAPVTPVAPVDAA